MSFEDTLKEVVKYNQLLENSIGRLMQYKDFLVKKKGFSEQEAMDLIIKRLSDKMLELCKHNNN